MSKIDLQNLRTMTNEAIAEQIIKSKRELLELRMQKSTKQTIKTHLFRQKKQQVARLLTIETEKKLKNN